MSADMPLLLSCPFCRGPAEYRRAHDAELWTADCTVCGMYTPWCVSPADAAKAWNRRPGDNEPKLHPATRDLVTSFAVALAEKLSAAEQKYGYSDNWAAPGWMDDCRLHLREHVEKGDPRDVAAYCAFLWYHGEKTVCGTRAAASGGVLEAIDSAAWLLANDSGERYAAPLREARYLIAEMIGAARDSLPEGALLSAPARRLKSVVDRMNEAPSALTFKGLAFFDSVLSSIPRPVKYSSFETHVVEARALFVDMVLALQGVVRDWRHPYDGGEFEDGEMPALDAVREVLDRAGAPPRDS